MSSQISNLFFLISIDGNIATAFEKSRMLCVFTHGILFGSQDEPPPGQLLDSTKDRRVWELRLVIPKLAV